MMLKHRRRQNPYKSNLMKLCWIKLCKHFALSGKNYKMNLNSKLSVDNSIKKKDFSYNYTLSNVCILNLFLPFLRKPWNANINSLNTQITNTCLLIHLCFQFFRIYLFANTHWKMTFSRIGIGSLLISNFLGRLIHKRTCD